MLAFFHPAARVAEAEAFLARRIDLVQLLARDVEPAQRPLEAPDGTFRAWVRDVGFRLCSHYATRASRLHRKHRHLAAWCQDHRIGQLAEVQPVHVAAFIQDLPQGIGRTAVAVL